MRSDQLTALKDPCYGISVLYDPVVRGNLLFGGMGDRNALLRSGRFFVTPPSAAGSCFCQLPESHFSPATHQAKPGMPEPAAASFGEPGRASDSGSQVWGLQLRRLPMSRPPAGREDGQPASSLCTLDRCCARLSCRGRTPSFTTWRVPKCSFSAVDPLEPQGSRLFLLAWQYS